MKIHYCNYSNQPDVLIFCNKYWTQPAWTQPANKPEFVYKTDDKGESYYTFNKELVTCEECLNIFKVNDIIG